MPYTLYYFDACRSFWGRAIGVVLTLEDAGAEYEIRDISDAPQGRFTFPNITLSTGETIGQVPAILNILGNRFDLTGRTGVEKIMCQQAVLDLDDIFINAQNGKLSKNPERATQWFSLLENKLAENRFLVSDAPTVADFHAVFATEWVHRGYAADAYNAHPRLAQWWKDICAHPPVTKMKAGDIPMIP
ncbi:MAG: glutathione S-transferase family protein [Pseudomonadota bacterium]